jgi:D-xylose transport system substrate-binding protein
MWNFWKLARSSFALGALVVSACQSGDQPLPAAQITAPLNSVASAAAVPAKYPRALNCDTVGVLFPDNVNTTRWETQDRPLIERELNVSLPGVKLRYANAGGDADVQQQQATQMLADGACILVVAAQDSSKAATIVELSLQRGVPVIAYDRLIHSRDLAYFVAFDNIKVGELQGEWLAQNAPRGGKFGMINGAQNDHSAQTLQRGAMNRLQPAIDRGDLRLVYELFTPNWNGAVAATSAGQMLDAHASDVQAIYVANDDMADAIIQMLQLRGLAGKILVTGQDATPQGLRNVLAGFQAITIYKNPQIQARNIVALVVLLRRGESPSSMLTGVVQTQAGDEVAAILSLPLLVDRNNAQTVLNASQTLTVSK